MVYSQQQSCECSTYEETFKKYRAAKDAGKNKEAEAIALALAQEPNPLCRILGLNLLANVSINASNLEEANIRIQQQKALLDSAACADEHYLEYFLTKSYYHYSQDEYDSSIANSLKALKLAEQANALTRQITLRLGIGSAFYRTGQTEKKMEYARSIIPLIEKVDDPSFKCQYYFNLFGAYYTYYANTKRDKIYLDSADLYNNKALKIARATNNKRFLPYCYEALEIVNSERKGSPQRGLMYIDSAIYFGRGSINNAQLSELLLNKAELYATLNQKKEATLFADSALYFSAQHPQKSVYASHLLDASELFSKLGNHQKSLRLYKEGDVILDSLKSVTNTRTVHELEEKYNKEKNEKTITQLSQEKQINQLQIRILIFGVIIALVAIVLVVFVYRLSSLKQQQQIIESKYRLNQALINPHFLSNALVSIQRFILENNAGVASGYLTKFSRLMRQLLEFSRQERISIEEEIDLLRNYLDLQKLRLKDTFNYTISVDEQLAIQESSISPMFIQPFVENAIEHGVNGVDMGKILIDFIRQNNSLCVTIQDNGKGISQQHKKEHQSMSTAIIQDRIDLLNRTNKEKISLTLGDVSTGTGTLVKLVLPIY
jgi:hypothetical protein